MERTFNQYQTPLTDELLASLPEEVRDELLDIINNVQFIQNLISPTRERAKDRPRDERGRIIVDLCKPHILEDMDYFRESALHFKEHGCYTFLKPNGNPNSEYGKWIRRERDRCWDGMVRPSDGEWIPGYMYFYLNYCPIIMSDQREGTAQADRITDFPKVWEGIYWRFHYIDQARNGGLYNDWKGALNGAELASRGKSKSYCMGSILAHNFVLGENRKAHKDTRSTITAYQKEYLTKDGTLNKFETMIDFCAQNTEFPARRIKSSLDKMNWIMGYQNLETGTKMGTKNEVLGVTSKDNIAKLRGKRSVFLGIEEFGSFPNLSDLYTVMRPSVRDGNLVFGIMYLQGTAGDKDSDFAGAQEIMYNPTGYDMYALPNVYDKTSAGKPKFVFFFPGYVNREGSYNKDGVSDVTKSLVEILLDRYKVKYNSTDPNTIVKTIAEVPITPSEAILRTKRNIFPVTDLLERLGQIDSNPVELNDVYVGEFTLSNGKIEFNPTVGDPIREFPHKDNKIDGAVEIFQMPQKISTDEGLVIPQGRYIASCDPVDDDSSETASLQSAFVLDLWTDQIVAEYTGRPRFAEDYYEQLRRLCLFYNAKLNYENNKKGIFAYFSKVNSLSILTDTLEYLKDKDMIKGTPYGNKAKGVQATLPINNFARTLIRDWLLKPVNTIMNVDGEPTEVQIPNLFRLRQRALIKELIQWNSEGNFDRVSSLGMLMLLREDRMILYSGDVQKMQVTKRKTLADDPFFQTNYKPERKKNVIAERLLSQ
jgi:hypothetical protein